MGINIREIDEECFRLGSETCEVYATYDDIFPFFTKNEKVSITNYQLAR